MSLQVYIVRVHGPHSLWRRMKRTLKPPFSSSIKPFRGARSGLAPTPTTTKVLFTELPFFNKTLDTCTRPPRMCNSESAKWFVLIIETSRKCWPRLPAEFMMCKYRTVKLLGSRFYVPIVIFLKCSYSCSLDDVYAFTLIVSLVKWGKFGCKQTRHCQQETTPSYFYRACIWNLLWFWRSFSTQFSL